MMLQEILLHEELKNHSFTPASNVKYYMLPCSNEACGEKLHPEGLHAGLFMLNDKIAYDHQLLNRSMDDMGDDGGTEIAAYRKLQVQYQRVGINLVAQGLPSNNEFKMVYRRFSELCAAGMHQEHTGDDGMDRLFECPICGPPEKAGLVMDGTASECIVMPKYIHIYMCTHIHVHTHTHIHVYTYTHIHVYTYTHIHIYTYTSIHVYTCTLSCHSRCGDGSWASTSSCRL